MPRPRLWSWLALGMIVVLGGVWVWWRRPVARPPASPHPGWAHRGGDAAGTCRYPFPARLSVDDLVSVQGFSVGLRAAPVAQTVATLNEQLLVGRAGPRELQIVWFDPRTDELVASDARLQDRWRLPLPHGPFPRCLADVDGDGTDEILLGDVGTDQERILVVDAQGRRCKELLGERAGPLPDGASLTVEVCPWTVLEVGPDRRPCVVASCRGLSGLRREILLFDYASGRKLWSYALGPQVQDGMFACADLNGDGEQEILAGTYAIDNDHQANGTDDRHSYVVAISAQGRRLWNSPALGGFYTYAWPAVGDVDGDGRPEVVVRVEANQPHRTDLGRVVVLDPDTGRYRGQPVDLPASVLGLALGDVTGGPEAEIVVGGRDGVIRVYDGALHLLEEFSHHGPVAIGALCDLDGDGRHEIVAAGDDGEVVVADAYCEGGRRVTTYPLGSSAGPQSPPHLRVADLDGDGRAEILALQHSPPDAAAISRLHVLAVHTADAPRPRRQERLTHDGSVRDFAWSPDGQSIAATLGPPDGLGFGLLVRFPASHPQARTVLWGEADACSPVWSPDGTRLAFLRRSGRPVRAPVDADLNGGDPPPPISREATDVWVIPAAGGAAARLTDRDDNRAPAWAPDGQSLFLLSAPADESGRLGGYDLLQAPAGAGAQPRRWGLTAPDQPSVAALAAPPPSPPPQYLALLRHERVACTYRQRDWALDRLRLLDLGSGRLCDALSDANLLAALRDPRNWVTPDQLCSWQLKHDLRVHVRDLAWAPDGQRLAIILSVARPYKDRPYCPTAPTDLWTYDVPTAELHRLTANDDIAESGPHWSPNGPWLAFEAQRSDTQPARREVWLVNTRSGDQRCLGPGVAPQWRPHGSATAAAGLAGDQLALLRDGDLWALALEPPRPPRVWPFWVRPGLGALVGALVTALLLGFHVPRRLLRLLSRWLAPVLLRHRPAVVGFADLALVLDRLERNLHQLSPALEVLPAFDADGEPDWAAGASRCLAMPSLWATLQNVLDDGALLLAEEPAYRRALGLLSPAYRPLLTAAFDRFVATVPALHQHRGQLARLTACEPRTAPERANWTEEVRQAIRALRALVDPDPARRRQDGRLDSDDPGRLFTANVAEEAWSSGGLLRLAECCKAALWVGTVLYRLDRALTPEAAGHGLRLDLPQAPGPGGGRRGPCPSALALVPGDPGALETAVENLVRNAFRAVVRQAQRAGDGGAYAGQVTVQVLEVGDMVHVTVADNGCGLSDGEQLAVREGRRGPGLGLRHVRRLVRDLPAGGFDLSSAGLGRGARATVSFRSL